MMGLRRDLSVPAVAVNIELWSNCLARQQGVLSVQPVVDEHGRSRKSPSPGHLCPYELYCYIDHLDKKHRITTGLTNHGGKLHVYVRTPSSKLTTLESRRVREVFAGASAELARLAAMPSNAEPTVLPGSPPPALPPAIGLPGNPPAPPALPPPPARAPPQPVDVKMFICPKTKREYVAQVDVFGEFTGLWQWCGDDVEDL